MARLKLYRVNSSRDMWEVERITGKKFTPDRSYPGALGGRFFISRETYFTWDDIKLIKREHPPFRVRLVIEKKVNNQYQEDW